MYFFLKEHPLKPLNTFGINVNAELFFQFDEPFELLDFLQLKRNTSSQGILILGGGSNILFTKEFEGLVIHPKNKGISIEKETADHIWIKARAGEIWDDVVNFCVSNDWGGLENLSLIPGCAGAVPVQNIGAFGVEVKDTIDSVELINLKKFNTEIFSNTDCEFGYRDSIFKHRHKGRYLVTSVIFKLTKHNHQLNIQYGNIEQELKKYNGINIHNIRKAVITARESKLPDPKITGNAGSFFKNPIISNNRANDLKIIFPAIPLFDFSSDMKKAAAGWMIEQCGWKGKWMGNAGVHNKHALILISNGKATGAEVLQLSEAIKESVYKKFGIEIEPEVNII
jgi:UDP-N-acetylmuramate dehydrogenase